MEELSSLSLKFNDAINATNNVLKKLSSVHLTKPVVNMNTVNCQVYSVSLELTKTSVFPKELKNIASLLNNDISSRYKLELSNLEDHKTSNPNDVDIEKFLKSSKTEYEITNNETDYDRRKKLYDEIEQFRSCISNINSILKSWSDLCNFIYQTNFTILELNLKGMSSKSMSSEKLNIITLLDYGNEKLEKI